MATITCSTFNGKYPDLAYEVNPDGGGRGRWTWDQKRPRFIGEDYFATGINPFDYAYFGGEATFQGKAQAHPAMGLGVQDAHGGVSLGRSERVAALGRAGRHGRRHVQRPLAPRRVLPPVGLDIRQRPEGEAHCSASSTTRTTPIPITLTWTLTVGGKKVQSQTTTHTIAPGTSEKFDVTLDMPAVSARQEGTWTLIPDGRGQNRVSGHQSHLRAEHAPAPPDAPGRGHGEVGREKPVRVRSAWQRVRVPENKRRHVHIPDEPENPAGSGPRSRDRQRRPRYRLKARPADWPRTPARAEP